jgi:protein-S-isoprenylcysteine O-methyltransferase Ste14
VWNLFALGTLLIHDHGNQVYAWVRHPRYIQVALALLGFTLIANYLAPYVIFALWLPVLYLIIRIEERELRDRFGQAYEEYCRKVPWFMPRMRRQWEEAG